VYEDAKRSLLAQIADLDARKDQVYESCIADLCRVMQNIQPDWGLSELPKVEVASEAARRAAQDADEDLLRAEQEAEEEQRAAQKQKEEEERAAALKQHSDSEDEAADE